jgi:hypothetical protein
LSSGRRVTRADDGRRFYGVLFHPEVVHTPQGAQLLHSFTHRVAGCHGDWTMALFRNHAIVAAPALAPVPPVQFHPMPPISTTSQPSFNCTTNQIGGTTYTNCRSGAGPAAADHRHGGSAAFQAPSRARRALPELAAR